MKFLDDTNIPDQPYPELRKVLHIFVDEIAAELRENLVGVYLVGSIASGDFDLDSDVDFLVVTNAELTEANMRPLQEIQVKIHDMDCYPAKHLEGSYISLNDLNDWSTVGEKKLYYFDNGSTACEQSIHDNKWHVRWILRERGITLVGQKAKRILKAIPLNELQNEIKTTMLEEMNVFQDKINRPLSFWNSRFGQSFFVLTYCRMLHTFHTGTVQSKKAGVKWAKQFVDRKWIKLIDRAWKEREGVRLGVKIGQRADLALLYETLDFMKYAVTQIDHMNMEFTGKIWFWRGPAPWYFVTVPEEQSRDLKAISGFVTYGWGVIPVHVRIGKTEYTTSLFPKDGRYLVPIKASVREAENLEEGQEVTIALEVR